MVLIFFTFALTTGAFGVLAWFIASRVLAHLQGNPEAVKAVVENVLMPIFGRKKSEEVEAPETPEEKIETPKEVF